MARPSTLEGGQPWPGCKAVVSPGWLRLRDLGSIQKGKDSGKSSYWKKLGVVVSHIVFLAEKTSNMNQNQTTTYGRTYRHTYLKSFGFHPKKVVTRLMFQWFSMFSHVGKQEPITSLWISVMEHGSF